jgi:hypothetical protein
VRVAIPWVILLALLVIVVTWWGGTKDMDFLTPPSDDELAQIRHRVEAALPRASSAMDAISVPEKNRIAVAVARPLVELGDVTSRPTLEEYMDRAANGATYLIELANLLEAQGHSQRTLLAWERVLDRVPADENQRQAAIDAIQRLKPTLPDWNTDPATRIPVVLQAGTGRKLAEALEPVLEKAARDLEKASSGILSVTARVNAARDNLVADGPVPVALWLCGPDKDSPSTDVLSFTVAAPDTLENDVLRTAYQLIRGHFRESEILVRPPVMPDEGDPVDALEFRITRRIWHAFGLSLQAMPAAKPVDSPPTPRGNR